MAGSAVRLVLAMVAAMWALEVVDVATGHALDAFGIQPRTLGGLAGVFVAPFLHFGFGHVAVNTVPFVVLGAIIAVGGVTRLLTVTALVAVVSGLGVWLLSPSSSVTAGASGLVFGYAGYLIARGVVSRDLRQLAIGVVVIVAFGAGLLAGLLPRTGVSWQGHLFGVLGGVLAARLLYGGRAGPPARHPATPDTSR